VTTYTVKMLQNKVSSVNHALERMGSDARVEAGHRYDYYALDLTCVDYLQNNPGATIRVLTTGTKRELLVYLDAMLWGLYLPADYPAVPA
jgi:hypothetical protein